MSSRLADRLMAARRRRFVGREAEKQLFQEAVRAAEPPFYLLYIYGPGGVGKSSLLRELISLAQQAEAETLYLDGRNLEPTPDTFLSGLLAVLGGSPADDCFELLLRRRQRVVLFVDTCETLSALDLWLRENFLPQLPEQMMVVLAGRTPPSAGWRADPGWQSLLKVLPLRNLTPEESIDLLNLRTVPSQDHAQILHFTHGHPLAISLVADLIDQTPGFQLDAGSSPDVVRLLLQRLIEDAPTRDHRLALEACALVRSMTEGLLSAMLKRDDAHEFFNWLRGLSFMESGKHGLFPHDLVREALSMDLRWRHPDMYAGLHERARNYYKTRINETQGQMQRRILGELVFLHRDNAVVRPFFEWQENETIWTDRANAADLPRLLEMVRQHESEEAAEMMNFWFERQPQSTFVIRDSSQQPLGFVMFLSLQNATQEEIAHDPATLRVWSFLQRNAPLRANEHAIFFRFWMDKENYQDVSPTQSRIFLACVQYYLTTPGLAYSLFPCADPDFYLGIFTYADLQRIPEADYTVGGKPYGLYGHDWRLTPPAAWLDLLAEREIAIMGGEPGQPPPTPPPAVAQPILVLSQPEFANAVREALRHITRTDELQRSPLLRSRIVIDRVGNDATPSTRASTLQILLKETAALLQSNPKSNKLYRALHHTYIQPAATQELAAEILDLPFSTYRRHLKEGIDSMVDTLWSQELGTMG